jgi:hypothetical protein
MQPGQALNVGLVATGNSEGKAGTAATTASAAAAATWLFPQNLSRQTTSSEPQKPMNDHNAFDFVQDHLQ